MFKETPINLLCQQQLGVKCLAITQGDREATGEFWTESEHTWLSEQLGGEQSVGAKARSRGSRGGPLQSSETWQGLTGELRKAETPYILKALWMHSMWGVRRRQRSKRTAELE